MTRVLVPSGALGLAFDRNALAAGISSHPDIIAIDGGSTDSGPFYLGSGQSKYSRAAIASDWRLLMEARARIGVPLVVGSAGTCGTDSTVGWMTDITRELARELGQQLRVALVKSSVDPAYLVQAWRAGTMAELADAPPLSAARLNELSNAVALMGVEQICAALETGADIIIAGRATDTATIAALPIRNGDSPGAAWHAAKVAECGALCSTDPLSGCVLVDVDDQGFEVGALAAQARCTPDSVAAHMLYENADPYILHEPGGFLDVSKASYVATSNGRVRVTGSSWIRSTAYRVKLEGAYLAGYQTTILAILRCRRYVKHAAEWATRLSRLVKNRIYTSMQLTDDDFDFETRLIGIDAALGHLETASVSPVEVGVLGIVTASSQELSLEIARLINPYMLHMPLKHDENLPTFAFPYSPAETPRGALYEFGLNHTLELNDPMQIFAVEVLQIGPGHD